MILVAVWVLCDYYFCGLHMRLCLLPGCMRWLFPVVNLHFGILVFYLYFCFICFQMIWFWSLYVVKHLCCMLFLDATQSLYGVLFQNNILHHVSFVFFYAYLYVIKFLNIYIPQSIYCTMFWHCYKSKEHFFVINLHQLNFECFI